jgi:hypothetical protein
MSPHRKSPRIVVAALLTAALAIPAVALATANSVSITAHTTAKVGVKFKFTVKGTSNKAGTLLSTFVNTGKKCATTYKAQAASTTTPIARTLEPKGNFSFKYSYKPASKGKRYVCAYSWTVPSLATVAKASSKFVTQ